MRSYNVCVLLSFLPHPSLCLSVSFSLSGSPMLLTLNLQQIFVTYRAPMTCAMPLLLRVGDYVSTGCYNFKLLGL
ncbi:hypothetical protein CMV_016807 [Castanea mollissima]|uniref:Secreted protein n=1 Tax=Castanea mollissima TaxID=60419 RepID=A0A8J4R7A0_9ROSI|nr:hypothetical protein CMV_016807 [Castanea mollissima]